MSLETVVTASIRAVESAPLDLGSASAPIALEVRHNLANGSAAGQASKAFSDSRVIAASGSENLDLAGALSSALGATIAFATVKSILVKAKATNANNVLVGPAASNGFLGPFADASDRVAVKPGGSFLVSAPDTGWTVTAGTGDLLTVANSGAGTEVGYDIVVIGT